MTARELLKDNFDKALEFLIEKGKKELKEQGHFLTGNLERSFESKIQEQFDGVLNGSILIEDYGLDLDLPYGERAKKLPNFKQHVTELYTYFQKRSPNLTSTQQYFFAVNTAKQHFAGNIPTRNSYQYSKNGRRTEWIDNSLNDNDNLNEALNIIDLDTFMQKSFDEMIEDLQRQIN